MPDLDFRYSIKNSDASLLESEFAKLVDARYAIAVNSCSSAMFLSLKAAGIGEGDTVFVPAFTFIAVPSAVIHAGAKPILVDVEENLAISLDDLKLKIKEHPSARCLLLSYMRGIVPDLDEIFAFANNAGLTIIEDAAHSLGGKWRDRQVGTLGLAGCFSTQSFKIIKSGEGGLVVTNNDLIAAKIILMSGAFDETWKLHACRPNDNYFDHLKGQLPCFGMRMTNIIANKIRLQIPTLIEKTRQHRHAYNIVATALSKIRNVGVPTQFANSQFVGDTILFFINGLNDESISKIYLRLFSIDRSVIWYGNHLRLNSRVYTNWHFISNTTCPRTSSLLRNLFEIKIDLGQELSHYERLVQELDSMC